MCDISAVKFQKAVNDFNGNLFESSLNLIGQVLLGLSRLVFISLSKEIFQLTQQSDGNLMEICRDGGDIPSNAGVFRSKLAPDFNSGVFFSAKSSRMDH